MRPELVWANTDKTGDCWVWLGARHWKGYGFVKISGTQKTTYAHRVAWTVAYGPIPEGIQVCHHCDNPPCIRPSHLFLGTQSDNLADMVAKGRQRKPSKTHCVRGHPLEERGKRRLCRTCSRKSWREYKRRVRA